MSYFEAFILALIQGAHIPVIFVTALTQEQDESDKRHRLFRFTD